MLAQRFSRALAGSDADSAARLRASQRAWLTERNACGSQTGSALTDCLQRAYRSRIAVLPDAPASNASAPSPPTAAAPVALPPGPPAGSASLAQPSVPAAGDHAVLLTVDAPGRFAIRATSKTGVALQLVDMIAGPGDIAGDGGTRDGRLDVLLDKGVYKLRTFGAKVATGESTLSVTPFQPLAPADAGLLRGGERNVTLADLQQRSFWVLVGDGRSLSVDATGRALKDLRAWRNGTDLAELMPDAASAEPKAGHPMTRLRLEGPAEPGLYLVTAYGGDPLPWSDGDTAQPLSVRTGSPPLLSAGFTDATIGPSGSLRYTLPSSATYVRLELPEVAPARMVVRRGKDTLGSDAIEKANREPIASATFSAGDRTVIEITGQQGQRVHLRAMTPSASLRSDASGPFYVVVDVAGDGGDEAPATAVLARFARGASKGQVIASNALRLETGQAWRRKFNLRGPTTLLVEIAGAGPVAARTSGVGARVTLEPLMGASAPRADGKRPRQWDVEAGFYSLKIDPVNGAVGQIDLTFGQPDLAVDVTPPAPRSDTLDFGFITFERGSSYQLFVNNAPHLVMGPRFRAMPANLANGTFVVGQKALVPGAVAPQIPPTPKPAPVTPPVPPKPQRAEAPAATPIVPKPAVTQRIGPNGPLPPKPQAAAAPAPAPPGSAAAKPAPAPPPRPPAKPESVPLISPIAGSEPLVLPVRTSPGGTIAVIDERGRAVAFTRSPDTIEKTVRYTTLTVPPSPTARTIAVVWTPTSQQDAILALPRENDEIKLAAGTPTFFDLGKDDRKSFVLDVADGGLYRVETLGRLKTTAAIGTRFLPKLDEADDNGPGHNALLQTWLRGGSYRVRVSAQESAGRLGLVARPARLIDGGTIIADGSARATLVDSAGAAFAIEIAESGDYRLDLYGLDRTFTTRLEDAEGWPLAAPGDLETLTRRLEKGRYRLVVMPPDTDAQVVARLQRVIEDKPFEGHGPHALPFEKVAKAQWHEPAKDAPRTPDRWDFTLYGPAKITLATSDGMTGDLLAAGTDKPVARIAKGRDFAGDLPAGRYAVEMRALGRDDRLDYTLELGSEALQPGSPQFVDLPATIPFAIAQDRVVGLTTFGSQQMSAVLRNEAGDAIERLSGRTDDWNIALSRRLPAGKYTLDLAALETPKASADDASETSDNADDPPSAKAAAEDAREGADGEQAAVGDTDQDDSRNKIEVWLALPDTSPTQSLALSGTAIAKGPAISRFALAPADAGSLLVIAAQADAEVVLSLERRDASGATRVIGFSRGRSPVVSTPIDAASREGLEVAVWPVDGGPSSATLAARGVSASASDASQVPLMTAGSDGPLAGWRVGHIATSAKTLLALSDRLDGMLAGSSPGRLLAPAKTGLLAPQGDSVWLLAPSGSTPSVSVKPVGVGDSDFALTLDGSDLATLPKAPADKLRVWRADATDGQPGFLSDRGAGIVDGSAVALAGDMPVRLWNAASTDTLAMQVRAFDVAQASVQDAGSAKSLVLPALSSQPLQLPAGAKRVSLQVAAGIAATLSGGEAPQTIWGGDRATSRELTGAWSEVLFVNTTADPAPAGIETVPATASEPLVAGVALKRFFGAAGALTLAVDAKPGDRLAVAGATATFVGADGRVSRGSPIVLSGPGSLTLPHSPGLVVAAVERGDLTPWSVPAPAATALPASLRLQGAAMALTVRGDGPRLLRARTTAPVILAVRQGNAGDPEPMPLGADTRRYLAAGDAELRLFSAHDGPLSGTLDLSVEPITPIADGIGAAQVLAPGASALFAFEVERAGMVGVGVLAEPDRVSVRLLDDKGMSLGEGVSLLRRMEKGRYLLEARAPADGGAITVRPAVVGLKPRPAGPPADIAANYLELVGMTKAR